jgi:hypothetical protein
MSYRMTADGRRVYDHAPGADLDYAVNWGEKADGSPPWLAETETIVSSGWTASLGISLSNEQVLDDKVAVTFAAGGEVGKTYTLINTITTSAGRTDSRILTLECRHRDS